MRMKIRRACLIAVLLLLRALPLPAAQTDEFFPLPPGMCWEYKGTVKWTGPDQKVQESPITWKMEVIRTVKNGPYKIAVVKGHPLDLCWYEPGKKPGDYLIVRQKNDYYFVFINDDLEKLLNDASYLSQKTDPGSLFLRMPLEQGMEFGMEPGDTRTDHMYRWFVTDVKRTSYKDFAGVSYPRPTELTTFTLAYRTSPDHQIVEFTPTIGITGFIYEHHGTVSEVNVRLDRYYRTGQ